MASKCGNKFKAGEARIINNNSNITDETKIKEIIKSEGPLSAVKWYKETYNCGLAEAKNAVDAIMGKNNIPSPNTKGTGCSMFLLIGIGLTISAIALF